ncbi:MAG: Spi family protease inhibitor [Bacteroidales bacterium]|nr:Spi family protease inhibitor [Bacteroidales bacterium]
MKKSLLFCISMLMMALAVAGPVNPRQAGNIALNFMMQKSSAITRSSSCQLVYTKTDGRNADALFYVFNVGEGFVMVSADERHRECGI